MARSVGTVVPAALREEEKTHDNLIPVQTNTNPSILMSVNSIKSTPHSV
jgi:hypothetical protein